MPLASIHPQTVASAARAHGEASKVSTLPEFYRLIETRLGTPYVNEMGRVDRDRTMSFVFRELEARFPDGPRIVETGCIRSPEDWSAGYATWLFGNFLQLLDKGLFVSIDNDPAHLEIAKRLCDGLDWVHFTEGDSVECLKAGLTGSTHLAYLDSMDTWHPGHAEHGLAEAQAASRIVAPNGLIVFDDSPPDGRGGWQGKGAKGIPWLCANGWKVNPISSYQTVLERA